MPIFKQRSKDNEIAVTKKTLGAFLDEHGLTGKLNEFALYNFGTEEPREINRALVELLGCAEVKDNPLQSMLDPNLGVIEFIHKPEPWVPEAPLALEQVHEVKVKQRLPVPAVSISKLDRWFIPKNTCTVEYVLEGVSDRASKVDFEVHATGYYEIALTQPAKEPYEKPCDTRAAAGTTDIFKRLKWQEVPGARAPAGAQKGPEWKGESEADKGVLQAGPDVYIHFGCAPYSALVRYYKDDADNKAKLLLAPFVPRWEPQKQPAPPELVEASLVVSWEIKDDNEKLKRGLIVVWDKDDNLVFFAPLDEITLRVDKKYELLKNVRKSWEKVEIKRDKAPYRVQIQAHSDEDEEAGLALAVMHTEVRAFAYDKVQFVAFNVKPGTKDKMGGGSEYLGAVADADDIKKRCDVMKDAIRKAHTTAGIDPAPNVLKLFMAPEFYFRGQKGGYPVDKFPDIIAQLREETDKLDYVDWLFVFGTAIGYILHEEVDATGKGTGGRVSHKEYGQLDAKITAVDDRDATDTEITLESARPPTKAWKVKQASTVAEATIKAVTLAGLNTFTLKLNGKHPKFVNAPAVLLEPVVWIEAVDNKGPNTKLQVISRVCSRIVSGAAAGARWTIKDSTALSDEVVDCTLLSPGEYELTLTKKQNYCLGVAELIEPVATEVLNVALVQKGWPAPYLRAKEKLKQAVIYKEKVSWIDFLGPNMGLNAWYAPDGSGRLIEIHGQTNRVTLPTEGAKEVLGASPSEGSEINKSGLGGGSVFTIDDVTFGLEVCLDHGESRLHGFYNGGKATGGDPKVQVQLIPSWGMSIGGGNLCCLPDGLVFNVDGSANASVARVNNGTITCDKHPHKTGGGNCDQELETYYCLTCKKFKNEPGNCLLHGTALQTYHQCIEWKRYCGTCGSHMPCGCAPGTRVALRCETPGCGSSRFWSPGVPPGTCPSGHSNTEVCGYYLSSGPCPQPPTTRKQCYKVKQPLGTPIVALATTPVVSSEDRGYFEEGGRVEVYTATDVPAPDFV